MKPWAEVEKSPGFLAAPDAVKQEIRSFYKSSLTSDPAFKGLPQREQEAVLRAVDGDGDYPIKMAAALLVAARKEELGRSVMDPKADEGLEQVLKGAKAAEHYLDVPLKDRPREPFQDEIPGHLDKPLRAVLGFIDDALPEYSAVKFWDARRQESLDDKLRNVLTMSSRQPTRSVDANAALNLSSFIKDYPSLDKRLPTLLPPFRTWSSEAQEKVLAEDPEAALKHGLPQIQWGEIDRAVITNLVHLLAGIKNGLPRAFRPDVVPQIVAEVKRLSYELLARQLYHVMSPVPRLPTDPDHIADTILAAAVMAQGMDQVADDFPSVFAVASGLSAVPKSALGRYRTFIETEIGGPMTPAILLHEVQTGAMSLIKLSALDEMLFQEAALSVGARPEALPHLVRDAVTAAFKPLMTALLVRTEMKDRQAFEQKKAEVRQKVQTAARDQMAKPTPAPEAPVELETDHTPPTAEEYPGASATAIPHGMPLVEEPAPAPAPTGVRSVETPENTVHVYLKDHPISVKSVKKAGLLSDFKSFPDVLEKDGKTLDESVEGLIAKKLLPPKADYNDLLEALDLRGAPTPPSGAEAAAIPAPAAPPASPLSEKPEPTIKTPNFQVRVVDVDPDLLVPRKTSSEIEPSRIRGVQQRFPEGKEYPAVAVYESQDGLHIIGGHHRTMVAKERGDSIKAVVISEKAYDALVAQGLKGHEIELLMMDKASQADAVKHLKQQYVGGNK